MMKTRRCSQCKQVKPLNEFKRDANRMNGRGHYCKSCNNLHAHQHYFENRERKLEYGRKYRKEHPSYSKEYYAAHREQELQRIKNIQYQQSHIYTPGEPLITLPSRDMSSRQQNRRV